MTIASPPQTDPAPGWSNPYVGIPYVVGGRSWERDGGVDCWGLLRLVYWHERGVKLPAYDDAYSTDGSDRERLARWFATETVAWERVEAPRPMDAVWMRLPEGSPHVGMLYDARRILHTAPGHSSSLVRASLGPWTVEGYFRLVIS